MQHAWQNFYDDTDGIQTELVKVWGKLAGDFAGDPAVAGYDLLNEPGFATGLNPRTDALGKFYDRTIKKIRQGEAAVRGLPPHRLLRAGRRLVGDRPGRHAARRLHQGHQRRLRAARLRRVDLGQLDRGRLQGGSCHRQVATAPRSWIGEWGSFSPDPGTDADRLDRFTDAQDTYGYGGAWWDWKQACGDPHVIHQPGGLPDPVSPSLIRYSCPSQQPASGPAPAYGEVLFRPLPRAVPGAITQARVRRARRHPRPGRSARQGPAPLHAAGLRPRRSGPSSGCGPWASPRSPPGSTTAT